MSQTVKLVFEIPLNEVTVSTDGQYYNLPYFMEGQFGKKKDFMKGKRITIPVNAKEGNGKPTEKTIALTKDQMKGLV